MKKLRIVVLSLSAFSLFYSLFWYIYSLVFNNSSADKFFLNIKLPISANIFTILFMFSCVLIWFIYQRKVREESVSNFIMFCLYLAYLILFIVGIVKISKMEDGLWKEYSYAVAVTSGFFLVVSIIPVFLHFVASICTGGYDNVEDPYNIYGFIYTIIGLCYIPFFLFLGLLGSKYKLSPFIDVFVLNDNGLIYTFIMLTFILCAGLRFNMVVIDILNIIMEFSFIIWWIVIIANYKAGTYVYLSIVNIIMTVPLFVLSIFILHHYIFYDRFYKGQTKNFLKD